MGRAEPPGLRAGSQPSRRRVIDHGPGIPADRRKQVFLPFQRLGDRDNHTGAVLGLALAHRVTETPGGGLTMVIDLSAAG